MKPTPENLFFAKVAIFAALILAAWLFDSLRPYFEDWKYKRQRAKWRREENEAAETERHEKRVRDARRCEREDEERYRQRHLAGHGYQPIGTPNGHGKPPTGGSGVKTPPK